MQLLEDIDQRVGDRRVRLGDQLVPDPCWHMQQVSLFYLKLLVTHQFRALCCWLTLGQLSPGTGKNTAAYDTTLAVAWPRALQRLQCRRRVHTLHGL